MSFETISSLYNSDKWQSLPDLLGELNNNAINCIKDNMKEPIEQLNVDSFKNVYEKLTSEKSYAILKYPCGPLAQTEETKLFQKVVAALITDIIDKGATKVKFDRQHDNNITFSFDEKIYDLKTLMSRADLSNVVVPDELQNLYKSPLNNFQKYKEFILQIQKCKILDLFNHIGISLDYDKSIDDVLEYKNKMLSLLANKVFINLMCKNKLNNLDSSAEAVIHEFSKLTIFNPNKQRIDKSEFISDFERQFNTKITDATVELARKILFEKKILEKMAESNTIEEIRDVIDRWASDTQLMSLNFAEMAAIKTYTGNEYININGVLRGNFKSIPLHSEQLAGKLEMQLIKDFGPEALPISVERSMIEIALIISGLRKGHGTDMVFAGRGEVLESGPSFDLVGKMTRASSGEVKYTSSFISTTLNKRKMFRGEVQTIFNKIYGCFIAPLSSVQDEAEFLMPPGQMHYTGHHYNTTTSEHLFALSSANVCYNPILYTGFSTAILDHDLQSSLNYIDKMSVEALKLELKLMPDIQIQVTKGEIDFYKSLLQNVRADKQDFVVELLNKCRGTRFDSVMQMV